MKAQFKKVVVYCQHNKEDPNEDDNPFHWLFELCDCGNFGTCSKRSKNKKGGKSNSFEDEHFRKINVEAYTVAQLKMLVNHAERFQANAKKVLNSKIKDVYVEEEEIFEIHRERRQTLSDVTERAQFFPKRPDISRRRNRSMSKGGNKVGNGNEGERGRRRRAESDSEGNSNRRSFSRSRSRLPNRRRVKEMYKDLQTKSQNITRYSKLPYKPAICRVYEPDRRQLLDYQAIKSEPMSHDQELPATLSNQDADRAKPDTS